MCLELINVSVKFSSVCWLVWVFPGRAGSRQVSISCLKLKLDYICCLLLRPFAKELMYWELIWCFCCWLVDMVFNSGGYGKVAGTWLVVWEGRRGAHGRSTGCQLAFSSPLRKVHRFIRWLHNNIISPFPLSDVAQQSAYMFGLSLFEFYAECYQETRTEASGKKWNTSQGNTTRRWLHNAQGNTAQDDWKWNIEKEDLHPNYPYSPCLQLILWSFSQLSS